MLLGEDEGGYLSEGRRGSCGWGGLKGGIIMREEMGVGLFKGIRGCGDGGSDRWKSGMVMRGKMG